MKASKQWQGWTEARLKAMKKAGSIQGYQVSAQPDPDAEQGPSKFFSTAAWYQGIRFASIKERRRYIDLQFLQQQGIITELRLQVPFQLNEDGSFSYQYLADFVYRDVATGQLIVEDAKGFRTREYRKKKKLMWKVHRIRIKET